MGCVFICMPGTPCGAGDSRGWSHGQKVSIRKSKETKNFRLVPAFRLAEDVFIKVRKEGCILDFLSGAVSKNLLASTGRHWFNPRPGESPQAASG